MPEPNPRNEELDDYGELEDFKSGSLLIGNGVSVNLSSRFAYSSLFQVAQLDEDARSIFNSLGTTNFEQVLRALRDARRVCDALGLEAGRIETTYAEIRTELFETVERHHVPWSDIPESVEKTVADALCSYREVFSTNYDLWCYWALLNQGRSASIKDFFWNGEDRLFRLNNCAASRAEKVTQIFYLHGALHLWQDEGGRNGKWAADTGSLREVSRRYSVTPNASRRPLFVSEGTAAEKRESVSQSEYLSFCFRALRHASSPLTILGTSLGDSDSHIADALKEGTLRPLAVGIYPTGGASSVLAEKLRFEGALPSEHVVYFDSRTHPLASQSLRVG